MRKALLIFVALFACALFLRGVLSGYLESRARSRRIEEILQQARQRSSSDEKIRADMSDAINRETHSFPEFQQQCADLQSVLSRSAEMDKEKREMLADLHTQFQGDQKVQPMFETLQEMEDVSDKTEPIWLEMIACSHRLESAPKDEQVRYRALCVDPAVDKMASLQPQISRLAVQLQGQIQKSGGVAPEFLRALAN